MKDIFILKLDRNKQATTCSGNAVSFVSKSYTGRFTMFSVITNIYNKKTKGPTLMELFTATSKLKKVFDS
jgi:hypothetical protein